MCMQCMCIGLSVASGWVCRVQQTRAALLQGQLEWHALTYACTFTYDSVCACRRLRETQQWHPGGASQPAVTHDSSNWRQQQQQRQAGLLTLRPAQQLLMLPQRMVVSWILQLMR